MIEKYTEDKRLLGALDYIDDKFIAEVTESYKIFEPSDGKITARRTLKITLRQFAALAACLILLSAAFPVVSHIVPLIRELFGGNAGNVGESSEFVDNSERDLIEHIGKVPELFQKIIEENAFQKSYSSGDYIFSFPAQDSDTDIIVYDKQCNIIDEIILEAGGADTSPVYKLSDGNYIKAQRYDAYYTYAPRSDKGTSVEKKASVQKFTADGKIVFTTEFDIKGAVDFVGEVDDGYIVSGIPQNWLSNDTECFYLYKLDMSGNLVYQRRIASNNVAGVVKAECVDGELVYYDRYVKSVIDKEYEFGYRMHYLNNDLSTRSTTEVNGWIENLIPYSYPIVGPYILWTIEEFIPNYDAGDVTSVIYYDDFVLIISERDTKWFEYVPMVYSSIPSYTETVYTAYTYDAEIIWRSAVDSTDYERLAEIKKEYDEERARINKYKSENE